MKRKKLYFGLGTAFVIFGTWMIRKRKHPKNPQHPQTSTAGWNSMNVSEEDI